MCLDSIKQPVERVMSCPDPKDFFSRTFEEDNTLAFADGTKGKISALHPEQKGLGNIHCSFVLTGTNLILTEHSAPLPMGVQDVGDESNHIHGKPSQATKGPGALKRKRKAPPIIDANPSPIIDDALLAAQLSVDWNRQVCPLYH